MNIRAKFDGGKIYNRSEEEEEGGNTARPMTTPFRHEGTMFDETEVQEYMISTKMFLVISLKP